MKPEDLPLLITPPKASKLIGLSETTLRSMCRSGRIKAHQEGYSGTWRITRTELLRYATEELGLELADFADLAET